MPHNRRASNRMSTHTEGNLYLGGVLKKLLPSLAPQRGPRKLSVIQGRGEKQYWTCKCRRRHPLLRDKGQVVDAMCPICMEHPPKKKEGE